MKIHELSRSKLAREVHVHTSTVSNWLDGKDVKSENLTLLCDYFGCSLDYLADSTQEIAPIQEDERKTEDEIKAAFFGGYSDELPKEEIDALWEDAREYARFKAEQRKRGKDQK